MRNTSFRKLFREEIDSHPFYGVVMGESNDLLYVAKESNFMIDGFAVLRKSDISSSVSNKATRYCFKILKAEEIIRAIQAPGIDFSSRRSVFRSLRRPRFISVENEAEGEYLVGPIVRINAKSIALRYFDGAWVWKEEENMVHSDITAVAFGKNYINMHEKYIKP